MRQASSTSNSRIRSLVHRGSRDDKSPRVARLAPMPSDGTLCLGCDAVFLRKTWRRRPLSVAAWFAAPRGLCPACRQVFRHESYGQVSVPGPIAADERSTILRRIHNVAARAVFTQPERRLVAVELRKTFGGQVSYSWSDRQGRLLARWKAPAPRPRKRGTS